VQLSWKNYTERDESPDRSILCPAATGHFCAHGENWPQWRGPTLNGVSSEKNLPLRWTTEENVSWKLAMPGWSGATPIIWNDRIFLNVADGNDLYLWCVDRNKGNVVWKRMLGSGNVKMRKQNMSSPSPVTDGKSVFVMTGTGILKGFDFDGRQLWARDIQKDYGAFGLNWGYASSPLLLDDSLYSSSPVLANDKIYVTNEDGLTTVVKAGPKFEVLAENALNDYCLSSPAISNGQIFIRTAQHLYCIGNKVKG